MENNLMRDNLMLEFMKNTKHRHIFVNNKCKFCEINIKKCKHEGLNLTANCYKKGLIDYNCVCGKFSITEICKHPKNLIDIAVHDGEFPNFCNQCYEYIK